MRLNLGLLLLVLLLCAASLLAGRIWLPLSSLGDVFQHDDMLASVIVLQIRLPRTVLALMVGGALGLGGAVLQGFTRNPLAEPGLLGVSTGAALGAVVAIYFGIAGITAWATPLMALGGALGAAAVTFALGGGGITRLVLAGVAVSSLGAAGIALALNMAPSPYAAYEIMNWLLGSLADTSWEQVRLAFPFVLAGMAMLATVGRSLDALSLGEAQAQSLGIDLWTLRARILLGTALSVGAVTAVSGAIGFVGLAAPHIVRPWVGHQPRHVLLPSALVGAILLLAADIAARLFVIGPEIKLGVFTSLIGAPFFFWLILKLRPISS